MKKKHPFEEDERNIVSLSFFFNFHPHVTVYLYVRSVSCCHDTNPKFMFKFTEVPCHI